MAPASRPPDPSRPEGKRRPARPGARRPAEQPEADPADSAPRQWGSLARKGVRRLDGDPRGAGTALPDQRARDDDWQSETWIDEGPVRDAAAGAVRRGSSSRKKPQQRSGSPAPIDTSQAGVAKAVGAKDVEKVEAKLREAARAYERERFGEARKLLVPLVDLMPSNAAVRELLGLTYYRMGRWKQATAELEKFREFTGSTEQHPVLADCYRALRRWNEAEALWDELREVSPSSELVTEGRIVAAGTLADRDRLNDAIALLDKGFRFPKVPQTHHLRRAYALADLRERAGDLPQARSLFERIAAIDPEFGDVEQRVRALR